MNRIIPFKFQELMLTELEHFGNCDNTDNCYRCNKLLMDLKALKFDK